LQHKESYHSSATFWLPSKFKRAREYEAEKQQQDEAEAAAKFSKRELQAAAKLLREQEKEECRVVQEKAEEVPPKVTTWGCNIVILPKYR
jgi:hypothetical protein